MTSSESSVEENPRSALILQAPPAWRQQIQAESRWSTLVETVEVRAGILPAELHPHRRDEFQADQTLTVAAEAACRSREAGRAIVCDEAHDRVCIMLAIHQHDRTELHCWRVATAQDGLALLQELLQRGKARTFELDRLATSSRFLVTQEQLLTEISGHYPLWLLAGKGQFQPVEKIGSAGVLSGSFYPLHSGHQKMREAARQLLGQPVLYEMTLQNADKPPLDWLTLQLRSRQFSPGELLLTRVPTFGEKAELLPGTTFVIGWDTAARVLERRFYPAGRLESSLETIAEQDCRFLVAARREAGRLQTLEDLTIPSRFRDLFSAIPTELFEEAVSSSSIRAAWLRGESDEGPPVLFSSGMIDY